MEKAFIIFLAFVTFSMMWFLLTSAAKEVSAEKTNCSGAIVKEYLVNDHSKIIHCLTVVDGKEVVEVKQISW
jgi:hypothetical protein